MIDKLKRRTLKNLGAAVAITGTAGITGGAMAADLTGKRAQDAVAASPLPESSLPLADIQVVTRVSASSNDIEIVIRNTGPDSTRITQMTPSQTHTVRGHFDFAPLLSNGDLTLASGQSVIVPMTPRPVAMGSATTANQRAQSLSNALKKSFSVITENDSFARVSVVDGIRFV